MKKITSLILLITTIILVACSSKSLDSLDGEYYWISSERNELAFTIKGDKGTIEHGEADNFKIHKENNTITLSGNNITDSTIKYQYNAGVITVNITGIEREYYQKNSKAYKEALKQFNYK
ncbi:hypothetical protein I6L85_02290 [Streptococcus gordonii]|uniref:hypothetical protein n=1 Tax=Streptococcus gordonii TaxID=1302 RepID=UPI000DA2CBC1|nr:hypothetical protein [Streptococcus gordonii]QXA19255.1 hypothetical protein I6L85_02290 [Streptococcus gordonii]SQG04708.1 lipoprotein [Streptococcus gordonii]